ncbi:AAA family ATPase [Melittangium boletus]|uniref:AAA family ATPase n=1 Tax=Melittangium boletus TaxID=83453 RepID=UPI003DA6785A
MHLSEFQLYNYKSFQDSGPIELKPGFNIITGQNNAGKTALLEGLGLRFKDKPHRSLVTHPTSAHANTKAPRAQFSISLHRSELDTFVSTTERSLAIPYPLSRPTPSPSNPVRLYDLIIHHELKLTLGKSPGHDTPSEAGRLFGLYDRTDQYFALQKQPDNPHIRQGQLATHDARPLNHEVLDLALGEAFISNIYTFRAERLNIGLSLFGDSRELKPDASNLPEVLSNLQSNPTRFQRYNQFVKRVLPQVESVTVRAKGDKNVEIIVWSYRLDLEREDLAVPLSEGVELERGGSSAPLWPHKSKSSAVPLCAVRC